MLSLLLFAGAYLLDLDALRQQKLAVGLLAVVGTSISILGIGAITYYAAGALGYRSTPIECLLFGALISPTDPIAVLEMLRRVKTPKYLEAQLAGESLFNDGARAVIFLALLEATRGATPTFSHLASAVVLSAGGGILLGVLLALPIALFMRSVNSAPIDVLLSLALALGGYAIADRAAISAPLEAVTSAIVLRVMTERQPLERIAHHDLNHFWSILDEIQNAILFVLLGCGFLVVAFRREAVLLGLGEIVIVNAVRVVSVAVVLLLLRLVQPKQKSSVSILSWGGLRGGLSIALALSVPAEYGGGWIVTSTYVLVVFSILVQGSTMGFFLRRVMRAGDASPA
ncbi:MAG: sodium:proton antiporter [Acidobacteriaceae bacterium]